MHIKHILWLLSFLLTLVFSFVLLFHVVKIHESYDPDETQLTDDASVNTYLDNHFNKKQISKSKRPIYVPTGVFISSISWIDAYSFFVSGYVWQKYPKNYPADLAKGFVLPEAVEIEKNIAYQRKSQDFETIGWYFEGKINQRFDYANYPLDHKTVMIRLWHEEFTQKVLLTPDFSAYDSTLSSDRFGLDPEIALSGYSILETFYRYRHPDYDTDFGLKISTKNHFPELYYNIVLKRHAVDAIIVHVLPLIVVVILCFSTLLSNTFSEKKRAVYDFSYLQILTGCAALFFVVLLAHVHLRELFPGVGAVYLEYMYIVVYTCVIYIAMNAFLVVHAELSGRLAYRIVKYKDNLIPKILFLPLFSALALLLSLRFFQG